MASTVAPAVLPELHAISAFSFLRGSSDPEALVERAAELGLPAVALLDRDGVSGAPRFQAAARERGLRPIFGVNLGVRLAGDAGPPDGRLGLLVTSRAGYQNLCALVTLAKSRLTKEQARDGLACVTPAELAAHHHGLVALLTAADPPLAGLALRRFDRAAALRWADTLVGIFGRDDAVVELTRHQHRPEERRTQRLVALARHAGLRAVATGDVRYAREENALLHDVFTCIREHTTIEAAGRRLLPHHGWHLQAPAVTRRRFGDLPAALRDAERLAERCAFTLEDLGYKLPDFGSMPPAEAPAYLHRLTMERARERYRPEHPRAWAQLRKELALIERLGFAGYFLIVWDIVEFCRAHGILVQGRGSAANSAVCYCLGITAVDPVEMELLFERFLSEERGEWPDIDLDLPSGEQRERVIQYVYARYGERGAAMTANVITYRARSAMREVGRALAMPEELLAKVSRQLHHLHGAPPEVLDERVASAGLDAADPRVALWLSLGRQIEDLPRHLGQHSGGMVIAQGRLDHVVPVEPAAMAGRRVIQWDKDDCAALGILKIDLLGLGMMAVLEEVFHTVQTVDGGREDSIAAVPPNDPKTYAMIRAADTVGVFQIESRAQMATLPRLKPESFYDLVVEVALIRPGPVVGQMVHPYLSRRAGREAVTYPHPDLVPVLARTLGIPLFQEQLMRVAMVAANFSGGEAEELRRAMGSKRSAAKMARIEQRLRDGMARNGYAPDDQETIIRGITSFAEYGFPESHSASFALLAYASAYLRAHYPATFTAGLLNHWPMGFYHPATVIRDAQRHGVTVLPIDVTRSDWNCTREGAPGLQRMRLGLRYVAGMREATGRAIEVARASAAFASLEDFRQRVAPDRAELETLAELGALRFTDRARPWHRREALWQVRALEALPRGIFDGAGPPREEASPLRPMAMTERVAADLAGSGVTVGPHPMSFARAALRAEGVLSSAELARVPHATAVTVAGMVITRQRPGSAKGFFFVTLEDEGGVINAIVAPALYEAQRALLVTAGVLKIHGVAQRQDGVLSVKAMRAEAVALAPEVAALALPASHDFH
jgi:error-prone DNA polymerase